MAGRLRGFMIAAGLALGTAAAVPAVAHHSFAMFDMKKDLELKGKITAFKWTNPHAWIEMNVESPADQAGRWAIEMNSPNNLVREGWKRTTLKPGDEVTIIVHPLRDGKKGGSYAEITLPDGSKLKVPGR